MRKQAVALLVHRDSSQVNALINLLQPTFDVYVHIDKKSNIKPEEISCPNVWKTFSVHWGGYDMVQTTVFLYKKILATGIPYTHVILLSGDALPVKSNTFISDFLNKYPDVSFIENNKADKVRLERRRLFWFNEDLKRNVKGIKRFLNSYKMVRWIQRRLNIWRSIEGFERTGSQWTILALSHVKHLIENCPFSSYRYMAVPDESFVQNHFTNFKLPYEMNMIYAHWPGNRSLSPNYIDDKTFTALVDSPYLFARKFAPQPELVPENWIRLLQKEGHKEVRQLHIQYIK
jgi:hypothetical protein